MGSSPSRFRTCIALKQRKPDSELLRLVVDKLATAEHISCGDHVTVVVADPARQRLGRGAWITPSIEALRIATKRGAVGRALKVNGPIDVSDVENYLRPGCVSVKGEQRKN